MTSDQVTVLSCNGFCVPVYNQGVLLLDTTLFLVMSAILMYIYDIYILSDTEESKHRMKNILQFFVIHILFSVADEIYTHLQYIGYKNQSSSLQ